MAGVKTGYSGKQVPWSPWVWEWFQRVTCLCRHMSRGRGAAVCNTQRAAGPWKVCAPGPIWVSPYPLPQQRVLFLARNPAHSALPAQNAFFSSCRLSYTTFDQEFLLMCSGGLVLGICFSITPYCHPLPRSAPGCQLLRVKNCIRVLWLVQHQACVGWGSYTVPAADLQGSFACADNHDLALWPPRLCRLLDTPYCSLSRQCLGQEQSNDRLWGRDHRASPSQRSQRLLILRNCIQGIYSYAPCIQGVVLDLLQEENRCKGAVVSVLQKFKQSLKQRTCL